MEKRQTSTKPRGACEKIYRAVAENRAFRSIHRLSLRSQGPISENATVGGRTSDSPSKTHFFLRKHVAPYKPRPGEVNIPIHPGPSTTKNEKEKLASPSVPQQSSSRVIMITGPKGQPSNHSVTKGDKTATPIQSQPKKPATVTVISESEKVKASVASGNAHLSPLSNMIVVHGPGQGKRQTSTKPAAKPHMSVQGLMQPKPQNQPAASVVKVIGKLDEPTKNTKGKEDKNPENDGSHDHNHRYSDYIEQVKNQLRTKSSIGEETTTAARPPTSMPTRRDSFNDRISNFITQARKNIKGTHLGD